MLDHLLCVLGNCIRQLSLQLLRASLLQLADLRVPFCCPLAVGGGQVSDLFGEVLHARVADLFELVLVPQDEELEGCCSGEAMVQDLVGV